MLYSDVFWYIVIYSGILYYITLMEVMIGSKVLLGQLLIFMICSDIGSNVGIYVIIWYIRRNLVYFDIFFCYITVYCAILCYIISQWTVTRMSSITVGGCIC